MVNIINFFDRVCAAFVRHKAHEITSPERTRSAGCAFAKRKKKKRKRERDRELNLRREDKGRLCFRRELIQRWKTLITLSRRTMAASGTFVNERIDGAKRN